MLLLKYKHWLNMTITQKKFEKMPKLQKYPLYIDKYDIKKMKYILPILAKHERSNIGILYILNKIKPKWANIWSLQTVYNRQLL